MASTILRRHMRALTLLAGVFIATPNAMAYRVVEQIEDAYEFYLSEVDLPRSITGSVSFRLCEVCDVTYLRVTTDTIYRINGLELDLEAFIDGADVISKTAESGMNNAVTVFFDPESLRVRRLQIVEF